MRKSPQRVEIYRNLHKKGVVYSIRDQSSKLIIGYTSDIYLEEVRFKVSQVGRERVLKEKRKNVHAVIQGTVVSGIPTRMNGKIITYNPYKSNQFFLKNNPKVKVYYAKRVSIINGKIKGTGLIFINGGLTKRT